MQLSRRLTIIVLGVVLSFLAVYLAGAGRFWSRVGDRPVPPGSNTVTYYCREGIIQSTYNDQQVRLVLPDGRRLLLKQAVRSILSGKGKGIQPLQMPGPDQTAGRCG